MITVWQLWIGASRLQIHLPLSALDPPSVSLLQQAQCYAFTAEGTGRTLEEEGISLTDS